MGSLKYLSCCLGEDSPTENVHMMVRAGVKNLQLEGGDVLYQSVHLGNIWNRNLGYGSTGLMPTSVRCRERMCSVNRSA